MHIAFLSNAYILRAPDNAYSSLISSFNEPQSILGRTQGCDERCSVQTLCHLSRTSRPWSLVLCVSLLRLDTSIRHRRELVDEVLCWNSSQMEEMRLRSSCRMTAVQEVFMSVMSQASCYIVSVVLIVDSLKESWKSEKHGLKIQVFNHMRVD